MAVTKDMLLSELQDLLRLTALEQTMATIRRSQAASTPIAEELAANAEKSGERRQLLADAVRQAGGVPDVVGAAFGKVNAFLQAQVNQVQTLQGALLGDLALEHQLRERARYARTLAESLGYSQVLPVLDRLETAHTATIEWLETRLNEVGRTGTSALQATPIQAAVTAARRTVGAPLGLVAAGVNRASSLLGRKATTAAGTVSEAAASAAEQVLDLTGLDEEHEPFPAYSKLSGDSVMRHVNDSQDIEHLREILVYEQAHKARKGVVQALEARLQELAVPADSNT